MQLCTKLTIAFRDVFVQLNDASLMLDSIMPLWYTDSEVLQDDHRKED